MNMIEPHGRRTENITMKEFPPFIRVTLGRRARKELFSRAMKRVRTMKREYNAPENVFDILYGKKKGRILKLLSENPQSAKKLIESSGLSPSAVYHFLNLLKKRHIVSKKGCTYALEAYDSDSFFLDEIVKMRDDPAMRRKYGISIKDLVLSYYLWDRFVEIAPKEGGYAKTYQNEYTLAEAVHRWKTGRTDIPVWALNRLEALSGLNTAQASGSVIQYHLPPGTPVKPYYNDEYKLPVRVNSTLDRIVIQLLQKMSKSCLYTFPKKRKWLFENLHELFGDFDDYTSRIPSAIIITLKSHYNMNTLNRSTACFPYRMRARWSALNPLLRITEESSLLLHIISLSSRSNGGFEITSRSESFLQDVSVLASDLGLGALTVRKKHERPHFRAYLSKSKAAVLRRYVHIFDKHPDLEKWMRIPLNQIAEKLVLTEGDCESVEHICYEELCRFVESILRSLEKKKREFSYRRLGYMQYKGQITDYFWERKLIPSPRKVEELVEMREVEEESLIYA